MRIEFDREADALYIQFRPGRVRQSIKIRDGLTVDISKSGQLFGIEILDVSRRIPLSQLKHIDANLPIATAR